MNTESQKRARAKYNASHKQQRSEHSKAVYKQQRDQIHHDHYNVPCSRCGATNKRILYHHLNPKEKTLDPIKAFDRNHPEELINCIPVCYSCHHKLHFTPEDQFPYY